jgi:hypothetical protein
MWTRSYSILTNKASAEQMWKLYADVNNWHKWDDGIEYARLDGLFQAGYHFRLRPKGGPEVKVEIIETVENSGFLDVTRFFLAEMYDQHTLEQTASGLKITNTISVKGILAFLWIKLVAQKIVNSLPGDLNKQIEFAATL